MAVSAFSAIRRNDVTAPLLIALIIGRRQDRAMRLFSYAVFMIGVFTLHALNNFVAEDNSLLGLLRQYHLGDATGTFVNAAFPLVHHLPVSPDLTWDKAHNTYLTLFAELGIVVRSIPILILTLLVIRFPTGPGFAAMETGQRL